MLRLISRTLPSLACLLVGGASFALSFVALSEASATSGAVPAGMAWLVPIVVDGGIIGGSSVIWANSYRQRGREVFPFAFVTALVAVSVVVNVAHASAGTPLGQVIAALPPLVLLGTLELVAAQHRRQALDDAEQAAAAQAAVEQAAAAQAAVEQAAAAQVTRPSPRKPAAAKPAAAKPSAAKPSAVSPAGPDSGTLAAALDPAAARPDELPSHRTSRSRVPLRVTADAPAEPALASA